MEAPNGKEIELLKTLRSRISDINLEGNRSSDLYLVSWLRARDLDVNKAEEMLRKHMQWGAEFGIKTILDYKCPGIFEKELPLEISGVDKSGCPIAIMPYGRWDLRKMIELGYRSDYLRYNNYIYNKLIDFQTEGKFTQFVYVIDMEGYSFRQLTSASGVDTTLEVARIFEANYPERLKTAYIINAPKIFQILFALVKPILSARTLAKVQIFSSNSGKWKTALLNNIPSDQLPIKYGGTRGVGMNMESLFSNTITNESGDTDGFVEVTVGAGDKLEAQYDVKYPNTTLSWKFKTDDFDICFGLRCGEKNVLESQRVDSHLSEQSGSIICEQAGKYILVFDNTYSVVRPKTLKYVVTVESNEDDDEQTNL